MEFTIYHHHYFHDEGGKRLERIEHLLHKIDKRGETFMANVKDILDQINAKTDKIAVDVTDAKEDLVAIKELIQTLKDGQTDPTLEAAAQEALDKLSGVETGLAEVAADLDATGKDGKV